MMNRFHPEISLHRTQPLVAIELAKRVPDERKAHPPPDLTFALSDSEKVPLMATEATRDMQAIPGPHDGFKLLPATASRGCT